MTSAITWQEVATRLWGEDFVAPLSEVLDVNRRTVSRWKTGVVLIPEAVERLIVECTPSETMTRELGDVLRQAANGADEAELRRSIDERATAVRRYLNMKNAGLGQLVRALSAERGGRLKNEDDGDE